MIICVKRALCASCLVGLMTIESNNNQEPNFGLDAQTKMHDGEIDIDLPLVKRLLAGQFPRLADRPLTLVRSTGTVNAVYRLGDDLCVRLPRVSDWAGSLLREWTWLPKLAPLVSLHIPKPVELGKPADRYPFPWAIYDWIDGESYQAVRIGDERQIARDLANFIMELRCADTAGAPHGGRDHLKALDVDTRSALDSLHNVLDSEAVSAAWTKALQAPAWDGKPVWIHGDLINSNLLVNSGQLQAVIDFGGAGIGDPAADIIPAWTIFGRAGRDTFRQAMNVVDAVWERARGYALHQALMIMPYYPETNPEFVSMAKQVVAEVLADLD